MLEMVQNFNPLLLDVIVVSVFILIIFLGFLKGIKKVFVNALIFSLSLLLAFSPLTNSIKGVFATKVLDMEAILPAGSSNIHILIVVLATTFLSSLIFFFLLYFLLHVLNVLMGIILKNKLKDKEVGDKSLLGRFIAALLSLIYQGAVVIVLLMVLNTNVIGMKGVIDKSTVTKSVVGAVKKLDSELSGDIEDIVIIKVFSGDLFGEVDDNLIVSYRNIENEVEILSNKNKYIDILNEEKLTNEEASEFIKERIVNLRSLAVIYKKIDTFKIGEKYFMNLSEEWLTTMNRVFNTRELEKIKFAINEYSEIRLSLLKAGVNANLLALYEEIATGN